MTAFTNFNPDGIIWSAGKHHIYVNGKPATVYVPPETIEPTYKRLKEKERIPLGIDHLSDEVLNKNEILAKMNLLDVGSAQRFGTDGENIYLLEGEVTNPLIHDLGLAGDLPSYSSVGRFTSTECERKDVDYVLTELDIERVDFVESGGCKVCKVGSQPDELILTSKLHTEVETMVEETQENETSQDIMESSDATEDQTSEQESTGNLELDAINKRLDKITASLSKVTSKIETEEQEKESKELKAKEADAKQKVEGYMEAGKSVPAEREALTELALNNPELFDKLMASRPKILKFEQLSNHAEASDSSEDETRVEDEDTEITVDELTEAPLLSSKDAKELVEREA
jgi:hypothetical protein